ncbi:hypothetical protein NET03_03705 [Thermomicrobium sp. CFH 73360]|uniref:hypothetical protein n=1 Tax=Thermomicrobium sp. CFH 73360 TaxID=2951987 RepID=UPI00207672F9|nr:hypothetical protein [Thermomicrobium sp. CFH 73360]MCM8745630.1 hypothetical protein [Thermomicrobium sp. CFH 73360]
MGRVQTAKSRRKATRRTSRATTPTQTSVPKASPPDTQAGSAVAGIISPWGRVDEEYALIKADLKRLAWVTTFLLVLLAVLTVLLR